MGNSKTSAIFRRTRFLAKTVFSSPIIVFVYSPLLVAQTVAGISVPFATGRFIDALVEGTRPESPFALLAALLLVRAALTPCLQGLVASRARDMELLLQKRALDAVLGFSPSKLSSLANGDLVAKLTRDTYAVGGFVSGLYPRFLAAVVTMFAAGSSLYSQSAALGIAFMAFIPLAICLFLPFARRFSQTSQSVRTRSDNSFSTLFDFFHSLPFLRTLDVEYRFANTPRDALGAILRRGSCQSKSLCCLHTRISASMICRSFGWRLTSWRLCGSVWRKTFRARKPCLQRISAHVIFPAGDFRSS